MANIFYKNMHNNHIKSNYILCVVLTFLCSTITEINANTNFIEESIITAKPIFTDTLLVSPALSISSQQLIPTSLHTSEDSIRLFPSIDIRRRYIGDIYGTLGIRGSNSLQTTRSMVFVDGLPLHYLLQTSFLGAPRWSLVNTNEIQQAQVIYGPFSAEYSGNAMGGVVNIITNRPTKEHTSVSANFYNQSYDYLSTTSAYQGGQFLLSYDNQLGNLGVSTSFNWLRNQSQPLFIFNTKNPSTSNNQTATSIGFNPGINEYGEDVYYYGDSGAEESEHLLYKIKLNYALNDHTELRSSIAYEQRNRTLEHVNNYLVGQSSDAVVNNPLWGSSVTINQSNYPIGGANFQHRYFKRNSLLFGLGLSSKLDFNGQTWLVDSYYSNFSILKDQEFRTGRNPSDPSYIMANAAFSGRLTEYSNTGWQTLDVKFGNNSLPFSTRLSLGGHWSQYQLNFITGNYDSIASKRGSFVSPSGGTTSVWALFGQWGWKLHSQWDLSLGLRYEKWQARQGYYQSLRFDDRKDSGWSPKLSLAYFISQSLNIRYSIGRAIRFPIVEELYQNERSTTQVANSNPRLKPEVGLHHNISINKKNARGASTINIFVDAIDNTIFSQRGVFLDSQGNNVVINTFLGVDIIHTTGVEVNIQRNSLFDSSLDLHSNVTWIRSKIEKNAIAPQIEGKDFPRIPRWRGNITLSYPFTSRLKLSTSIIYASDAFGDLDNKDTTHQVFGAIDSYIFTNVKANWSLNSSMKLSFGVDNLFNKLAFVHNPWPSRTFYIGFKYN